MRSVLIVLLALGALYLGYDVVFAKRSPAAPGPEVRAARAAEPEGRLALALDPGDATARDSAAAPAPTRPEPARTKPVDRLASAHAALEAGDPKGALDRIGPDNTFLGRSPGRAFAAAWLDRVGALEPARRVALLSAFLDRITHGPQQVWRENYRLLEKGYAMLQDGLRETLFSPRAAWRMRLHRVAPGESLATIARRYRREFAVPLSAGLLQALNRIRDPRRIRPGQRLRIPTDPLRVVVEKGSFSLKLFLGETLLLLCECGLGKDGCTPTARFRVVEKQVRPPWTDPRTGELIPYGDPRHLIGDYFVKLGHPELTGFGIHGTRDQASIGTESSMGCIRLRAKDMEKVFALVPRGAEVWVRG